MSQRIFAAFPDDQEAGGPRPSLLEALDNEALVVIALISLIVMLIFVMAVLHCWLKCWSSKDRQERRLSSRSSDLRYIQQIQRLLERQKEVDRKRNETLRIPESEDNQAPPSSRCSSPGRPRSRISSAATHPHTQEKLARLKEELEQYKVDHGIQVRSPPVGTIGNRRRTWGGLQDEEADPFLDADYVDVEVGSPSARPPTSPHFKRVPLPNVCTVGVQTTGTLERKFPPSEKKVFQTSFETTV